VFARYSRAVHLSPHFQWLVSDQAIIVLGLLAACEILAQKFPGLDNVWDFLHTLLRPVAGAIAAGAVLNTNQAFELVVAMLMGGALAAATHSAKSTVRLASTSKSLGTANILLSLGEDAAVVAATLLALYAPWIMLGVVLIFLALLAWIGPRLARAMVYNLQIVFAWFKWLWQSLVSTRDPSDLRESLLELSPARLKSLNENLETGEELEAALEAWKRSRRGPRRSWLLVTPRRLALIQRRMFRKPKIQTLEYKDLAVVRVRRAAIAAKIDLLTRTNESHQLSVRKTHFPFARLAADRIGQRAGLPPEPDRGTFALEPGLASIRR